MAREPLTLHLRQYEPTAPAGLGAELRIHPQAVAWMQPGLKAKPNGEAGKVADVPLVQLQLRPAGTFVVVEDGITPLPDRWDKLLLRLSNAEPHAQPDGAGGCLVHLTSDAPTREQLRRAALMLANESSYTGVSLFLAHLADRR